MSGEKKQFESAILWYDESKIYIEKKEKEEAEKGNGKREKCDWWGSV